jgi:hypothetical protein
VSYARVFLAGGAAIVLATLFSLRRAHIRVEYSVSWLAVGSILLVCSIFPRLLVLVAGDLGLDPQICFIFIGGALALALLFEVSLVVSQLRDENVILTQKVAILEYHLGQMQSRNGGETE